MGLEDSLDEFPRLVLRVIVDDDHMEVRVLLLQDGPDVAQVPLVGGVVEGGHYQAEGQLRVCTDIIP